MILTLLGLAHAGGGYDWNQQHVRWSTLETEHFYFHWPESTLPKDDEHWFTTEFTAGQLARIAEEAYGPITEQFDYDLIEKTHVVIYDQDVGWEGNGFAIAESDWTGFAANWGPTFRERGRMEFLSDVFVHEFAHIVSLKAFLPWSETSVGFEVGGLAEDEEWLRRIGWRAERGINFDLGFDVIGYAHAPYWWAEGGAEYWSHQAGYNFWGGSRDAYLRMSVYEDRVLTEDEWTTRIDKINSDGERGYNHGYAFGLWLRARFGTEAMTEMARVSARRFHWSWDRVVEEVTGVPMHQLYEEWRAHLDAHYGAQMAEYEARGIVEGREISLTEPLWEKGGEDWEKLSKQQQDELIDGIDAWQELPTVSPDGRFFAWHQAGAHIMQIRPVRWGAVSGEYIDEDDKDKLKKFARQTADADFLSYTRLDFSPDSKRVLGVAHEDLGPEGLRKLQVNWDGRDWPQLAIGTIDEVPGDLKVHWELLPHTLRATEAAWAPDNHTIAFSRYGDGTHELWTIQDDGSGATQHSHFGDGTQIQGIDWSADGRFILVSLFRNFQQDLWLYEPATDTWTRLTDSASDETDPTFGPDGRVWFTSDREEGKAYRKFDVYALDLVTHAVHKQTEVRGGAYGAYVAPHGQLFYTAITGHGFRIEALPKRALKELPVEYPGLCGVTTDCADAATSLAYRPPGPDPSVREESRRYNPVKSSMPLSLWPVIRTTDKAIEVGSAFYLGDYVEEHYLEGEATFGKDNWFYLAYYNDMFPPSLQIGYGRYTYKGTYGYVEDYDGIAATANDAKILDVKFEQVSDDFWLYGSFSPGWSTWIGAGFDASRYSFRDTGDGPRFVPYVWNSGLSVFGEYSNAGGQSWDDPWINPRGGRTVTFDYGLRFTTLVDPEIAGQVYDDGERFERYHYNTLQVSWTEFVPVPGTDHHTLQLNFQGGYIDRNVMGWDELGAGGKHPYFWGNSEIGDNTQFSGYEGWSLTGETLLILSAAYRFPVLRNIDHKVGPVYFESVYLQAFGTAGNLWSHRIDGPTHVEGYSVVPDGPGQVHREIPFVDASSKNSIPGKPNYMLTDAGVELRLRAFIWNDFDWDSFIRVAYGFRPTAGYGDVNSDFIQSSLARDSGTELSGEYEPPTFRVYAGLGTGW